jgi:hypothetical protein
MRSKALRAVANACRREAGRRFTTFILRPGLGLIGLLDS